MPLFHGRVKLLCNHATVSLLRRTKRMSCEQTNSQGPGNVGPGKSFLPNIATLDFETRWVATLR
jgi:hypothetical protein